MVFLTRCLFFCKDVLPPTIGPTGKVFLKRNPLFIDSIKVKVIGGRGGSGFPKYGGLGGKGGDVYFSGADDMLGLTTMKNILKNFGSKPMMAGNGEDSRRYKIVGGPGTDAVIKVPVGVDIVTEDGNILGKIDNVNQRVLVARGGQGGCRENHYNGVSGQERTIVIDYKLLADVGLVGYPNAGKSSLLKAMTRASPKIANYPFTTLKPNLGIIDFPDLRQISVADLPGLIEGAHVNKGLGFRFLRHIEKTRLLMFVIDIDGFEMGPMGDKRTPIETLLSLQKEMMLYNPLLLRKPAILVVTKCDHDPSSSKYKKFLQQLERISEGDFQGIHPLFVPSKEVKEFDEVVPVSSLTAVNIPLLREVIRDVLDHYTLHQMDTDPISVSSFKELRDRQMKQMSDDAIEEIV